MLILLIRSFDKQKFIGSDIFYIVNVSVQELLDDLFLF
jgi:hypothetical protein